MTILFVDDEYERIEPDVEALRDSGHTVLLANSVQECRQVLAREGAVDVVILDVMLPAGDLPADETRQGLQTGLVLLSEIRRSHPSLKVLLFSNATLGTIEIKLDPYTHFFQKAEILPSMLSSIVGDFFAD